MPNKIPTFRPKGMSKPQTAKREATPEQGLYATRRWKRLRLEAIREHVQEHGPYCLDCHHPLDFGKNTHVDHIVRHHGVDDPLAWQLSNLAVRCASCHSSKTRAEERKQ